MAVLDQLEEKSAEKPRPRYTRASRPKVRTGCKTCKIRRVKCDEGKPFCNRCTSTGRVCDGYISQSESLGDQAHVSSVLRAQYAQTPTCVSLRPSSMEPVSSFPDVLKDMRPSPSLGSMKASSQLLNHRGDPLELRSLAYFRNNTAPKLAGCFDKTFWNHQLLQISEVQPAVRHAMIAVASTHELTNTMTVDVPAGSTQDYESMIQRSRLAISHNARAISELRRYISHNPEDTELILLCCILFVTLEILRGDSNAAVNHLHSGLQILSRWREENPNRNSTKEDSLEDNLSQLFYRLSFQSILCEKPLSYLHPDIRARDYKLSIIDDAPFESVASARKALMYNSQDALQNLRHVLELPPSDPEFPEAVASLRRCTADIYSWDKRFLAFLSENEGHLTQAEKEGSSVLRAVNLVAGIWSDAIPSLVESTFDSMTDKFLTVLDMAETMFQEDSVYTRGADDIFSLEMRLIPSIFFVATKCRQRRVRRRAVAMLERVSTIREGLWNGRVLFQCAKYIIRLEEEHLGPLDEFPDALPAERHRVRDISGMGYQDPHMLPLEALIDLSRRNDAAFSRAGLVRADKDDDDPIFNRLTHTQDISFLLKPDGVDGPWLIKKASFRW